MKRGILAVILVIVGAATALAADIAIPALTGRVVDQAGILSSSDEASLSGKLAALEKKTTIQLVVVTLSSLQSRTIEEWGLALGRGWGIGQAGKNNGVLLIVAPKERELRIEVGYGLEGDLPDATADSIIRNVIVPRFKAGNMVGGINDGVDAIGRALAGEPLALPTSRPASKKESPIGAVAVLFFLVFIFIVSHVRYGRRRRPGGYYPAGWYWSSGSGGPRSSGWSSGGGGGFSGGGGSFGGGGASGRW
ncbi:MAG TPA: TPM domain-containing protein [Dongiaceae bacterium]|nr:TPM domain-containing protein [Dongiaceae bacterium]